MKRYISVLLAAVLLLSVLAGCGSDPAPAPSAQPAASQPALTPTPTTEPTPTPTATTAPAPEPTPEPAPEPTPDPLSEEFLTWEIEEVIPEDNESIVGTGKIFYPVYDGPQADVLNRLVETVVFARQEGMKQTMRDARKNWEIGQELANEEWFESFEETEEWSSFRCAAPDGKSVWLVLAVYDYSYTGGVHGSYSHTYLVTDYESGEAVFLSELLREYGTDIESVGEALVSACEAMAEQDDGIWPASDYIRNELTKDGYWYPSEDGIHFIAPPYALASYAMGEVEMAVPWEELVNVPSADSGVYDRGEGGTEAKLDVLCRDYSDVSMLEIPVIVGTDSVAAQAVNDELARLARTYYAEVAEDTELWQDLADFYVAYHCYPCSTDRYLSILETCETTMNAEYSTQTGPYFWVYDKQYDRRVTLTDALLMSGYHYDDFLTLLAGAMTQVSEYSLEGVAFRMLPDGTPEFYLLVWWTIEDEDLLFGYSTYSFLRIGENGSLYACDEYPIAPLELDSGFTTGPLSFQAAG